MRNVSEAVGREVFEDGPFFWPIIHLRVYAWSIRWEMLMRIRTLKVLDRENP